MKKIFLLIGLSLLAHLSPTFAASGSNEFDKVDSKKFYVGINPVALLTRINTPMAKLIIPTFSNMEYDLALNGGYFINDFSALEMRFSIGQPNLNYLSTQTQIGYNFFVKRFFSKKADCKNGGFYAGIFARHVVNDNLLTNVKFYHIIPNLTLGYRWEKQHFFYDVRLNQLFAAYSWSSLANTKPTIDWYFTGTTLIPVFPTVSFNLGFRF